MKKLKTKTERFQEQIPSKLPKRIIRKASKKTKAQSQAKLEKQKELRKLNRDKQTRHALWEIRKYQWSCELLIPLWLFSHLV